MNIDSYDSLTTRIGRLRSRRCGSTPPLTILVAYAPTSSYEEEELEAFYMGLERLFREDHTFFKVVVGDFNAKIGPRRTAEELHIGTHGIEWNEQGERFSEFIMSSHTIHGNSQFQKPSHLRWTWELPGGQFHNEIDHIIINRRSCLTDVAVVRSSTRGRTIVSSALGSVSQCVERAMRFRKRSPKTSINWDYFASLASEWEDPLIDNIDKECNRLVEHLHDSASRESTSSQETTPFGDARADRPAWHRASYTQSPTNSELAKLCREAIKEDLKERRGAAMDEAADAGKSIRKARRSFANNKTKMTSFVFLTEQLLHIEGQWRRQDEYIAPSVLPSEIRHAIKSMKNCTAPGLDRIKPDHLKSLPPDIVRTLARLLTRYLSECKVSTSWKTSKTVDDLGNYRPICLLSVIYKLFARVILNRITRILDEGQSCEQARFRRASSTNDHIHALTRLIEVSREQKMPLCLTFIDLKKALDTVETEAIIEDLGNQGAPTQYIRMLRELYDNFAIRISPF
ncbi:hypothetical protein V3C99_009149 [Haemonchus contortus]|uniref:Reverse transcriptase domain-containing protein n=1 Tax=Haemonchus contortus TaxID=6289 RepID=A0A7I5EAP7_HAECO